MVGLESVETRYHYYNSVRVAKIRREIKILKALHHPSIIRLEAVMFDTCCKTYALVTPKILKGFDYIDSSKSEANNLTDSEIRFFLRKLLEGLHYSHTNGIMHRDIKPQNVLIDR